MYCSNCGKEIADKAVICVHCGAPVNNVQSERSWLITLLLCLFLGTLGLHRFYTNKTGSAVAQLLMTLSVILAPVTVIWVFIDLIVIVCGNFKTKEGFELKR